MSTFEEKRALRAQGLTYRQIAERLGISHQAVASSLSKSTEATFRFITSDRCIYEGLRAWMNNKKISVAELSRRLTRVPHTEAQNRLAKKLRGCSELKKNDIDKIIYITGLKYEELF